MTANIMGGGRAEFCGFAAKLRSFTQKISRHVERSLQSKRSETSVGVTVINLVHLDTFSTFSTCLVANHGLDFFRVSL